MAGLLGDLASIATLILFLIYFLGRIIKNGVFSELVMPKHTIRSILYYLCR